MTKQKKGGFSQRQAAVAQGRQAVTQRTALIRTGIIAAVFVLFAVLLFFFVRNRPVADEVANDNDTEEASAAVAEGTAQAAAPQPTPTRASSWTIIEGPRSLSQLEPISRAGYYRSVPPTIIDPERQYQIILQTAKGDMRLHLYADQAPLTVNNFVSLALDGYYDSTTFHRVLAGFMAQGGDPTGTGMGGPGYQFADEIVPELTFDRRGLLAMANSGPGTNGSQFFITFAPAEWLNGNHTIFGEVIAGQEVLDAIRLREPSTDPAEGDLILQVIVLESEVE